MYIITVDEEGRKHRKTIGGLTVETKGEERMVPNDYFKNVYQDLWNEEYPDNKIPLHEMSIGIYALSLSICTSNGLYEALKDVYGTSYVNSILDYAMFSIVHRNDVTQLYENMMRGNVLFSDKLYSDSWYSEFFSKKITMGSGACPQWVEKGVAGDRRIQ